MNLNLFILQTILCVVGASLLMMLMRRGDKLPITERNRILYITLVMLALMVLLYFMHAFGVL